MMRTLLLAAAAATAVATQHCRDPSTCAEALHATSTLLGGKVGPALERLGGLLLGARSPHVWKAAVAAGKPNLRAAVGKLRAGKVQGGQDSQWCADSGPYDFVPVPVANLTGAATSTVSWSGDGCFGQMTATTSLTPTGVTVTLKGSNPSGLCADAYTIADSYSLSLPVEVSWLAPSATATLSWAAGGDEAFDVNLNGLSVMLLPCGLVGSITSIINTAALFAGANETDVAEANLAFLTSRGLWTGPNGGPLEPFGRLTNVDKSIVRSGDYLAILKLDGLDPMITFGTAKGGTGHSALAVWQGQGANRTLHICESTDKDPFGPAYFPPPYGIICHTWDQWIPLANEASFHVTLLPLTDAYAAAFNETAFWEWFATVQFQPYGYHNFLYAVLDTADPIRSLPLPIVTAALTPVMNLADQLLGDQGEVTINVMLVQALNKRLGTNCSTLACTIAQFNRNKAAGSGPANLAEATAIPEDDSWRYGGNVSYVCSAFAAMGWRVALGSALPPISATEQTPIDNVRMGLYNGSYFSNPAIAAGCPGGVITPQDGVGTACQLMGQVVMPLNGFNSVPVYANMNSACGSQWPNFERCLDGTNNCEC